MSNSQVQDSPDSPDCEEAPSGPTAVVIPFFAHTSPIEEAVDAESTKSDINCLLVQDTIKTAAPIHLQQTLQHYEQRASQAELLVCLVYLIALECGYIEQSEPIERLYVPPSTYTFHSRNVRRITERRLNIIVDDNRLLYRVMLRLLLAADAPSKLQLIAIVSGDLLIVTLSPGGESTTDLKGYSMCLPIARYVLAPTSAALPLHTRFLNLIDLTQQLRENILMPMRNQLLLQSRVCTPYSGLLGLPMELYGCILLYLSKNQQNIVANVCKRLNYVVKETQCSWQKKGHSKD